MTTRRRHPLLSEGAPHLVAEWSSRNDTGPDRVTCGSGLRPWWQCARCGHEWQAYVAARATGIQSGCPGCAGVVATPLRNLAVEHPTLAAEWHPVRNAAPPDQVTSGSGKRVWWMCSTSGHEYQASVASRTSPNTGRSPISRGCPQCSGRVATHERNFAVLHATAAAEWHPTRNDGTPGPDKRPPSSRQSAWWLCSECGYEWQATLSNRAKGAGCHSCSGQVVTQANCLLSLRPDVARLWHPTRNGFSPRDVTVSTRKRVWWLCDVCTHEWASPVHWRTARGSGCPSCSGQVVTPMNCLLAVAPDVAREWHPVRNGDLLPSEVTAGSGRRVWWCCSACSHEWAATVVGRAGTRKNGCPRCVFAQSSRIERAVFEGIRAEFPTAANDLRVQRPGRQRPLRPDIAIPDLRLVVEYDGAYWHRGREDNDRQRDQQLADAGWDVLRVREAPLGTLSAHDIDVPSGASAEAVLAAVLPPLRCWATAVDPGASAG